jgi:putative flippase GtrA
MSKQLFRYAFCGSVANILDIFIFFISYHFILKQSNLEIGFLTFKPHVAAIMFAFLASFPVGFFLQKYITFTNSNLRGRVQLFRYLLIVGVCFLLNIALIKLLVEQMNIFPTLARVITTVVVVVFSYFTQRNFSFREKKEKI